ncbi:MAG: SpoIID/LytB domain-containing protein [Eubacteriales bacterium]|nr:SpoIID/LytB domain-containing protein [Eubacteriales bacterium]
MSRVRVLIGCLTGFLAVCVLDNQMWKKEPAQQAFHRELEEALYREKSTETEKETTDATKQREPQKKEKAAKTVTTEQNERDVMIRVLIKSDDYESEFHRSITVLADGKRVELTPESPEFENTNPIHIHPISGGFTLPQLRRAQKAPVYEGDLEIYRREEGLLLVNELPLEEYLCAVVPSEMPSGYPMEALKAQAVCARTYALKQRQEGRAEEFYADVDDSVSYQVYNNQGQAKSTDQAVLDTAGMVLEQDGELADALYYSTSCGLNTAQDFSEETVFASAIISEEQSAYEAEEPWYRWRTQISLASSENIREISVKERTEQGAVQILQVIRDTAAGEMTENVVGEYQIRAFLAEFQPVVELQDKTVMEQLKLLPSAFFILRPIYADGALSGYEIIGGGYGHGQGMSQNGAKHMALEGMGFEEILSQYYKGAQLAVYDEAAEQERAHHMGRD